MGWLQKRRVAIPSSIYRFADIRRRAVDGDDRWPEMKAIKWKIIGWQAHCDDCGLEVGTRKLTGLVKRDRTGEEGCVSRRRLKPCIVSDVSVSEVRVNNNFAMDLRNDLLDGGRSCR